MSNWIWESTPIHLEFDSDTYFGKVVEPMGGETWIFNLPRHAEVTAGVPGKNEQSRIRIHPENTEADELDNGIRIVLDAEGVRCVFEMTLDQREPELLCTVREVPISDRRILSAVFPGALFPKNQRRHEVLDTVHQGRIHRPVLDTERRVEVSGAEAPMAWWAQLGGDSAVLAIAETPFDWHWTYTDSPQGSTVTCRWISSLGALNDTRRLRYVFLPGRGYMQPARRYRRYAKETGLHVPMAPRIAENPTLDRLLGACAIFLGHIDDPSCDYVRNLTAIKDMGLERAFVYPLSICSHQDEFSFGGYSPVERAYLGRDLEDGLDFIAAPGIWVDRTWERGSTFRRDFLVSADEETPVPEIDIAGEKFHALHSGYAIQMLAELEEGYVDYLGVHCEGVTTRSLRECRRGIWSYSRKEDARLRCELLKLLCDRRIAVSAGEQREWSLGVRHLGANMTRMELGANTPVWPVPLWQLVYHDASFSTWPDDEGYTVPTGSHRRAFLMDMLYANVPLVHPMGCHYRFTKPPQIEAVSADFADPRVQESLRLAVRAARHHRRYGLQDLIYHAILTGDGAVQESAFESGAHVIVNLGSEPYRMPGGQVLEAESVLVD